MWVRGLIVWSLRLTIPRSSFLLLLLMDSPCAGPFSPSTLTDVPIEYIIEQLRSLAPHYWENPETADCTISPSEFKFSLSQFEANFIIFPVVPIPYIRHRPKEFSSSSKFRHLIDLYPSATESRITETCNGTRQLTFKASCFLPSQLIPETDHFTYSCTWTIYQCILAICTHFSVVLMPWT